MLFGLIVWPIMYFCINTKLCNFQPKEREINFTRQLFVCSLFLFGTTLALSSKSNENRGEEAPWREEDTEKRGFFWRDETRQGEEATLNFLIKRVNWTGLENEGKGKSSALN